ncbi:hypothetical protein GCM10010420_31050 [Streptomyces glaucosporus]|uniref:Uncharacterized protein n=1 Tax=Streptomyces glaucosporus TaxID=284044 RepID=A0ABN3IDY9_9ACTN
MRVPHAQVADEVGEGFQGGGEGVPVPVGGQVHFQGFAGCQGSAAVGGQVVQADGDAVGAVAGVGDLQVPAVRFPVGGPGGEGVDAAGAQPAVGPGVDVAAGGAGEGVGEVGEEGPVEGVGPYLDGGVTGFAGGEAERSGSPAPDRSASAEPRGAVSARTSTSSLPAPLRVHRLPGREAVVSGRVAPPDGRAVGGSRSSAVRHMRFLPLPSAFQRVRQTVISPLQVLECRRNP